MIKSDSVKRKIIKLSQSKYKHNFILKGGFLLSKIFGENNRTTRDIDTTIKVYL